MYDEDIPNLITLLGALCKEVARLITFKKPSEAEALPDKVAAAVEAATVSEVTRPVAAPAPVAITPKPAPHPATAGSVEGPKPVASTPSPSLAVSAAAGRGLTPPRPASSTGKPATVKIETPKWKQALAEVAKALPQYTDSKFQPDVFHILNALAREGWRVVNDSNIGDVLPTLQARAKDDIRQDAEAKYTESIPF